MSHLENFSDRGFDRGEGDALTCREWLPRGKAAPLPASVPDLAVAVMSVTRWREMRDPCAGGTLSPAPRTTGGEKCSVVTAEADPLVFSRQNGPFLAKRVNSSHLEIAALQDCS